MKYEDQFEKAFMKRTLELVEEYRGPYDATILLNCLLGLLIVPKEKSLEKIPNDPISDIEKWGISPDSIQDIGDKEPATLRGLVINLRHAIAHTLFTPVYENEYVLGFEFKNRSGFKAFIKLDEMKKFVNKLAKYIENEYKE